MIDPDIVIVGAGAAGVGAARRLAGSGRAILLVEASDRVGGRGATIGVDGMALDLGCTWLHSAVRNPWSDIAAAAGIAIDRRPQNWGRQYRDLGFSPAEQRAAWEAYEAFEQRLHDDPPTSDRAIDALPVGGAWNGFIDALSGYMNGAGLATLSVEDFLAYDDHAGEENWRLPGGYGALIARSLPAVPLALATPVSRIDHDGAAVRLETPRGTITARAAIVTVSTDVLAAGDIAFSPTLDDHLEAASRLPLGLANKLFLQLDDAEEFDPDSHLLGRPRAADSGSYFLRPFGRPLVECFFGGEGAHEVEALGFDGGAAFAIDELAGLLGNDIRSRLRLVAGSAWGHADGFRGSYSHALPGHHAARAKLAEPVADRLFFAGEACSPTDFSTAHGALASGIAAAEAALAAIG